MNDIFWKKDGGGFYLLNEPADGYVFVGHSQHRALLDDAALNAKVIIFDDVSGQPVAVAQQVEVEQDAE